MTRINYVVACFLGQRRLKTVSDPRMFLPKHLDYLQNNNIDVARVTVVLNSDDAQEIFDMIDIVNSYRPYYTELRLLVRPNSELSYGAWNTAIKDAIYNNDNFSHYFFMEDDYAPGSKDFLDRYMSKMTDDVGYVCHKVSHAALSGIFGTPVHAGMSSGLMLAQAAEECFRKFGEPFTIIPSTNYDWYSVQLQIHFLDYLSSLGYKIVDASDITSVVFVHPEIKAERGWGLLEYGNPNEPRAIEPIIEWELFRQDAKN